MSGKSKNRKGLKMPKDQRTGESERVKEKENILMDMLSPMETQIMNFQGLLVWEKPQHSIALWIGVHLLFWLAITVRFFFLVGFVGFIIVVVDMWKNHIWPEIRVPVPPGEDDDDWTPVHPHLISVPEICHSLAWSWVYLEDLITSVVDLRANRHAKFFVYAMLFLSFTAAVGCYFSGILLIYGAVLFALLWPCVLYNNGLQKIQEWMTPALAKLEARMKIKRTPSRKALLKGKRKSAESRQLSAPPLTELTDSESEDLEEFVPKPDPLVTAKLDPNASDSDNEGSCGTGMLTIPSVPSCESSREPTPFDDGSLGSGLLGLPSMPSVESSREQTPFDDLSTGDPDDPASLAMDVAEMPSYDDTLDGSHTDLGEGTDPGNSQLDYGMTQSESLLPDHEQPDPDLLQQELDEAIKESTSNRSSPGVDPDPVDPIQFINTHYSQFSDSDDGAEQQPESVNQGAESLDTTEDHFAENMSFPDVVDETIAEDDESGVHKAHTLVASGLTALSGQGQALYSRGQALVSSLHTPTVSNTVSALMSSTVAGLTSIKETVAAAAGRGTKECTCQTDNPDAHTSDCPCYSLWESADSQQLEAEFEFLDQDDLNVLEEEDGIKENTEE